MKHPIQLRGGRSYLMRSRLAGAVALLFLLTPSVWAQATEPSLEKKVRGILETHCYRCHSHQAGKSRGELMLDSRALMVQGGETGAALVPGDPEKSLLIKAIRHEDENLKMPPQKEKLSAEEIALLTAWVKAGAPWTETPIKAGLRKPGRITEDDRRYWAFQPIKAHAPSAGEKNPIDGFIRARLQKEGIRPAGSADARILIRRIYFDLVGLPPTPEETEQFIADCRLQNAELVTEALIDRLLASPHYGERWGRHWLDVVRFSESDGYRIDTFRPHAWRYRDYVIKSFNDDKPYDQFVREQIAGDELCPNDPDGLVAIGFLTHGAYEFNQRDVRGQWHGMLSEIVDVTGEAFLGLSVGCARCHDHKFDPILQKDYYALRAFFEGVLPSEDLPYARAEERAIYEKRLAIWEQKTANLREQIEAIEGPQRAKGAGPATVKFPADIQRMLKKPAAEREPLEQQLAALAHRQIALEYMKLDAKIKGAEKDRLLELRRQLAKMDADKPAPLPLCQSLREVGTQPGATTIPRKSHAEAIRPAFLTVLQGTDEHSLTPPEGPITPLAQPASSGRRAALARWLTRSDHPLTSRVLVNRIWQQHFGLGLVVTANDFGNLGDRPSHPELLDWLAQRFVQDGWSMKKLHRLILTSKTYQQSSAGLDRVALQKDPGNRLLWRMPSRRLDAEQIRDAMLAITGKLDRQVGGPSVEFKEPRRSVYLKWQRNTKDPLLDVFDLPDGFGSTAQRNVSTTATQALFLINSPLMLQQGQAFAGRLHIDNTTTDAEKIDRAFRLAFARAPSSKEAEMARAFLGKQSRRIVPPRDKTPAYETAKIPFHEGTAVVITPGGAQARLQLPENVKLPSEQFTLEAFIYLRTVFDDGQVRTIASHWTGDTKGAGWAFGVTGKKSAYKPQSLVLQLWGQDGAAEPANKAIFSGLHVQLNRPYYVAVGVNLKDAGDKGITFYLKDLANDEEPLQIYSTTHKVVKMSPARGPFTIGGTIGKLERSWDGMIDDVRLSNTVLAKKQLLLTADGVTDKTVAFWQFEQTPGMLQDSSSNRLTLQRHGSVTMPAAPLTIDARRAAWVDLCQVLLNANEFLYVD
jgi:mono/diheme cytochrome c family protein